MLTVIFPGYLKRSKVNNGRSLTLLFLEKLAPGRRGIRSTVSGYPLFSCSLLFCLFCRKDFVGKTLPERNPCIIICLFGMAAHVDQYSFKSKEVTAWHPSISQ